MIVLVAGSSMLSCTVETLNMAIVMPNAICQLSMSSLEQGLVNCVAAIGILVSIHFWSILTETWGPQKTLRTALALSCCFCFLSSFSISVLMLMLTRFGVGLRYR